MKYSSEKKKKIVLEFIRLDVMTLIYCYLVRENCDKVLIFHKNNFPYSEITASPFQVPHLNVSKLNKC